MFRLARKLSAFGLLVLLAVYLPRSEGAGFRETETTVPIRIGWQIPAATQGQVLQVLKRTNVLEVMG